MHFEENILRELKPLLEPHLAKCHSHKIEHGYGYIRITCQPSEDPNSKTLLLLLRTNHQEKQAQIPNIFMPESMRGAGLGKRLISVIYNVATRSGYELFLTDMMPGFFKRMVARGAEQYKDDIVRITDETRLTSS